MDNTKDLRETDYEVEYLGQKEQEERLGKVAQDSRHGKRHSSEVAEGVAHKNFAREFVVLQQSKAAENKGSHNRQGESVVANYLL